MTPPPRPHLLALTWPLLAEMVLGFGVSLAGLALAARVSDNAAAAFSLSNQVLVTFFLLFRIISMGVSVVITQNLGAHNRAGADHIAKAALGATSWLALGVGASVLLAAAPLLHLVNAPVEILQLGAPYLQVLAFALMLDAFNAHMAAVLRAHMRARDTMFTILAMHLIHLALCLPLMRGAGPIPPLGLVGFALAMIISRSAGLAIHLTLWRVRLNLVPRWADWWRVHWADLGPVLHIGLPGAAENVAYRLAMLASLTAVAGMGAGTLATHSYATQIMNLVVLATVAIGFACEILVGHLVGAGQFRQAHRLLRKSLLTGLAVSFCIALGAAITAPWTMQLFTHDAAIIASATTLLWLTVLLEPGRTCNVIIINALRATGDARFPVVAGAASMLLVMAGGSWLLGVYFQLGLVGVWIAYIADEWLRGLTMAARWFWLGWLPKARATRQRVMRQQRAG